MVRLFHNQACRRNRVQDPFDRGNGSGLKVPPFHDGGIHPLHPVKLAIRSSPRVEQSGLFQKTDRTCNSGERIGQAYGLRRRHTSGTGASVGKNEGAGAVQLRRRSRACRYAGFFMRSRSDRTKPRPVTQSSKLSESFRNRGGSSPDGPSAICATIPYERFPVFI